MGAPLAILCYFSVAGGQKPMMTAVSVCVTAAFLYVVLYRWLAVPFPPGALLAWAGAGR